MADEAPAKPQTIAFHYIKSSAFRVIYVEGAVGGATPTNTINLSLFNERLPIPQKTVYQLTPGGRLEHEIEDQRVSRDGIVREVEVDLILNLKNAKEIVKFLQHHIEVLEQRTKAESE